MRRRFRFVRVLKWAGALTCLLILAALVASAWFAFGFTRPRVALYLTAGRLEVNSYTGHDEFQLFWPAEYARPHPFQVSWGEVAFESSPPSARVPLWLLFLVAFVPTLLLWRLDHRVPPGHCRKCRYNLTGNTTGRCPECGAAFAPAAR